MLERTLVYVDTSYLLASFYNSWETGARGQLEIDLREVVHVLDRMITSQLGQPVQRQLWYDGIPESGPHRYQRSLRTIDGVQLRAGQLIEWGDRRTQKAVDTRLVADMVIASVRGHASDIVLVSGDADMLPGVSEASNAGVRVHLYGFGWDSMSSALRHACDSTTILDPREDFAESMQLNVLEGPVPPIVRDKPLGDVEPPEAPGATEVPDTRVSPPGTERDDGSSATASPATAESAVAPAVEAGADAEVAPAVESAVAPAEAPAETSAVTPAVAPADKGAARVATPRDHAPAARRDGSPARAEVEITEITEIHVEAVEVTISDVVEPAGGGAAGGDTGGGDGADYSTAAECGGEPEQARPGPRPNPSMMAPRRKLRSRYVPLPNEVWASAGTQTPFDVGQQYANWWYEQAATDSQRDDAHLLSGGGLPPEIDRPLLQFACETLHEYTLTDGQRVSLRDGFHAGIRGVLLNKRNGGGAHM